MIPLLRAELIKLRTTRTFWALAGVALAISLLITILVTRLSEPSQDDVLTEVFTSDVSSLFICILGIVGITGEWRHRTITSSLLAMPDRVRFLLAKLLAFAAAGVALSLAISAVIGVVGMLSLEQRNLPTPETSDLIAQFIRNAEVAGLLGAFGVGLGALIRNQPTAIVALLLLGFVIDPTLGWLAPDVARYGPTGGLPAAIQELDPEAVGDYEFVSVAEAWLFMGAWIGALFAAGAALLVRRDVE